MVAYSFSLSGPPRLVKRNFWASTFGGLDKNVKGVYNSIILRKGGIVKQYIVTLKIKLTRQVAASSKRDAEEIARDMGEYNADIARVIDWKAKLINPK